MRGSICLTALAFAGCSSAFRNNRYLEVRDGVEYNVIEHAETSSRISYVKNSGICETTEGVNQYSGYFSVGEDMNMWFWFFESREDPQTAPLVSWFGGGPGNAAEYGLFTQNGPCQFYGNDTEPSLNPYSFNSRANVLYVDQPIGTGFSYGNNAVNSTKDCAPYVWYLLQAFYDAFPEYENRDFGLFTESYGGHTGPEFVRYILERNEAIAQGEEEGHEVKVVALGASNAWVDVGIQEKSNIDFAYNNNYRQLINNTLRDGLLAAYNDTALPLIEKCNESDVDADCYEAFTTYLTEIEYPIMGAAAEAHPDFILADVRPGGRRPPTSHVEYLQRPDVRQALGAQVNYTDSGGATGILNSGDDVRSFLDELSFVVNAGVKVLIWTGDADYVCNWLGTLRVADAVDWYGKQQFSNQKLDPYTVNGVEKGAFKSLDNLTFVRVFGAGHNLMWYQPETGLNIFNQFLLDQDGVCPT